MAEPAGRVGLARGAEQLAFVCWSLATSVPQLLFGFLGDRYRSRWLTWLGPAVAVVCVGCVGLVSSTVTLCLLLMVGGLGIAAFHPEAAAMAGACLPHHRSRAMSVFVMGGFLGQAVGPAASGQATDWWGLSALVWLIPVGLPAILVLMPGLLGAPVVQTVSPRRERGPDIGLRGRFGLPAAVLAAGSLRIIPALGMPLTLAYVLRAQGHTNADIGIIQSVFMAGMGIGVFACAVGVSRRFERRVLWALPLAIVPLQIMCVTGGHALLTVAAAFADSCWAARSRS